MNSVNELREAYQKLKEESPNVRAREAANKLNISEAQLLAISEDTIRLEGEWPEMLKRFRDLDQVMSLTRNDACVLEHKGRFKNVKAFGSGEHSMATVIGPIETRVFFKNWKFAFASTMTKKDRVLRNIQIFDAAGEAITKVYLQEDGDLDAYKRLVADFTAKDQNPILETKAYETQTYEENIDQEEFLKDWSQMKDPHDFFPMLRKHSAKRHHAMQLAEGKYTRVVENNAIDEVLYNASEQQLPIMIFAGNRGNIQIHQDVVNKIVPIERNGMRWINVMDPKFNLHLRTDMIHSTWVVEKPTEKDGIVTSIETYDANNEMIVQFFGLRKPGKPELTEWKELVKSLK